MSEVHHLLTNATKAAEVLKEHLREIAGDDVDLMRDMIEGETPLNDLLAMACSDNVTDVGLVNGLESAIGALRARKDRIEKRIGMRRVAMLAAMETAEIKVLETPTGTLSRRAVPASALVLDETAVPSQYWKPADPTLDKKAVLAALKAGTEVPGCMLSNGGETLSIRS
jgi:hypothetical protein